MSKSEMPSLYLLIEKLERVFQPEDEKLEVDLVLTPENLRAVIYRREKDQVQTYTFEVAYRKLAHHHAPVDFWNAACEHYHKKWLQELEEVKA